MEVSSEADTFADRSATAPRPGIAITAAVLVDS